MDVPGRLPRLFIRERLGNRYALQLRSGEIQVYFTDSEPLTADSGTAMLRSMDNGGHGRSLER